MSEWLTSLFTSPLSFCFNLWNHVVDHRHQHIPAMRSLFSMPCSFCLKCYPPVIYMVFSLISVKAPLKCQLIKRDLPQILFITYYSHYPSPLFPFSLQHHLICYTSVYFFNIWISRLEYNSIISCLTLYSQTPKWYPIDDARRIFFW